jgi:hypothetical protein
MYKQDQKVRIDNGVIVGIGWIRGKAISGQPVIGEGWIVEMESTLCDMLKKDYPYTHIVAFDNQLKAV